MNRLFIAETTARIYKAFSNEVVGKSRVVTNDEFFSEPLKYGDVEYLFSTWTIPILTEKEIESYFPKLKAVFYAAGSVAHFAMPYMNRGIRIFSAWMANAISVAEFTVAQIILSNKGYFHITSQYKMNGLERAHEIGELFPGNYDTNVGLIGFGAIGKNVAKLLRNYKLNIYVYDKFLSDEEAERLNVKKVSLNELFEKCDIISNHLADKPELKGILNYSLFSKMKKTATFINTGRGAQVNEEDLICAMNEEPLRMALLDVHCNEGNEEMSKLWNTRNIKITPHRAGAFTKEILRMGEYLMNDYDRLTKNERTEYEITFEMLEKMA